MHFLGYHGTSETSAKSILSQGIHERFLPPTGQIGRGFYLARHNGTLPQWGASWSTRSERDQMSLLVKIISLLTGEALNPLMADGAKMTILKIYSSRPLCHCKWNKMNPACFSVIQAIYLEGGEYLNLVDDCKWLQMVVPPEELQFLSAKRDDGVFEQPHNWHAKESLF